MTDNAMRTITGSRDRNHKAGATICHSDWDMRAPYGLNILDNCLTCPVREEHLFCNLPMDALQKLNEIKSTAVYPKSAVLFIEGQQPRGVFVLCAGKVKLSTSSSEGKTLITKLSEAGDVLSLNATISNHAYEVTAEMIEPGQANFIPRDALLRFLHFRHNFISFTQCRVQLGKISGGGTFLLRDFDGIVYGGNCQFRVTILNVSE